jgi:hypothetical protein
MMRNPDTRQPLPDPQNYKRMFINPMDNAVNPRVWDLTKGNQKRHCFH